MTDSPMGKTAQRYAAAWGRRRRILLWSAAVAILLPVLTSLVAGDFAVAMAAILGVALGYGGANFAVAFGLVCPRCRAAFSPITFWSNPPPAFRSRCLNCGLRLGALRDPTRDFVDQVAEGGRLYALSDGAEHSFLVVPGRRGEVVPLWSDANLVARVQRARRRYRKYRVVEIPLDTFIRSEAPLLDGESVLVSPDWDAVYPVLGGITVSSLVKKLKAKR